MMTTVSIRLSPDELAVLDELRGEDRSRSAFMREMLRHAGPIEDDPSHEEALRLLARSARAGRVTAQVALERALRGARDDDSADNWLGRLLDE